VSGARRAAPRDAWVVSCSAAASPSRVFGIVPTVIESLRTHSCAPATAGELELSGSVVAGQLTQKLDNPTPPGGTRSSTRKVQSFGRA